MNKEDLLFFYMIGWSSLPLPLLIFSKSKKMDKNLKWLFILPFIPILNIILLIYIFLGLTRSIIKNQD